MKLGMWVRGGRSGGGGRCTSSERDSKSSWLQSTRKAGMECNLLNISQGSVFIQLLAS